MTHLIMRSYAQLAPVALITEIGGYAAMFVTVGSTKKCTDIPSDEYDDLSDTDWYCSSCM